MRNQTGEPGGCVLKLRKIPAWLAELLANPPDAGGGVHAWLFRVSRQLHAHLEPEQIEVALLGATQNCGRPVPVTEIRDAIRNSAGSAWKPTRLEAATGAPDGDDEWAGVPEPDAVENLDNRPAAPSQPSPVAAPRPRWPRRDPVAVELATARAEGSGVGSLYDLFERSPIRPPAGAAPGGWIERLFGPSEFVCMGTSDPKTAATKRRPEWSRLPEDAALVVANPMTARLGATQDGRPSPRCLGNTGARRWVVLEFDQGTIDEQAGLHWYLTAQAERLGWPTLRLAVHSGGKSLHGWYGPVESEETAQKLMTFAARVGADPATWNKCQLVRLPGGLRPRKEKPEAVSLPEGEGWEDPTLETVRQEVYFYSPFELPTPCESPKSSAPSELQTYSATRTPGATLKRRLSPVRDALQTLDSV